MAIVLRAASAANKVVRPAQLDFGIVEENAGDNKLHMRRVSKGMTIHVPQGEPPPVSHALTCTLHLCMHPLPGDAPPDIHDGVAALGLHRQWDAILRAELHREVGDRTLSNWCSPLAGGHHAGIVHFSHNPTCQPAQFLANFGERDPGAQAYCPFSMAAAKANNSQDRTAPLCCKPA